MQKNAEKCGKMRKNAEKCGKMRHQVALANSFELEMSRLDFNKEVQYIQQHSVLELAQACCTGRKVEEMRQNLASSGTHKHI